MSIILFTIAYLLVNQAFKHDLENLFWTAAIVFFVGCFAVVLDLSAYLKWRYNRYGY